MKMTNAIEKKRQEMNHAAKIANRYVNLEQKGFRKGTIRSSMWDAKYRRLKKELAELEAEQEANLGELTLKALRSRGVFDEGQPDTRKELLPGAVANYGADKFDALRDASKAMVSYYGSTFGYAVKSFRKAGYVYEHNSLFVDSPKQDYGKDNPQVEQIDTLKDLQRQMLDVLDGLKECRDEIERNGNNDIAARLNTYVIAHIECSVTSEHGWLDSSTSIDSIIEELEDEQGKS